MPLSKGAAPGTHISAAAGESGDATASVRQRRLRRWASARCNPCCKMPKVQRPLPGPCWASEGSCGETSQMKPDEGRKRVIIETIQPQLDCGRYPPRRYLNRSEEHTAEL